MGVENFENFILIGDKLNTKDGMTIQMYASDTETTDIDNAELLVNFVSVFQDIFNGKDSI